MLVVQTQTYKVRALALASVRPLVRELPRSKKRDPNDVHHNLLKDASILTFTSCMPLLRCVCGLWRVSNEGRSGPLGFPCVSKTHGSVDGVYCGVERFVWLSFFFSSYLKQRNVLTSDQVPLPVIFRQFHVSQGLESFSREPATYQNSLPEATTGLTITQ